MKESEANNYFAVHSQSLFYAGVSLSGDDGLLYTIYVVFIFLLRLVWAMLLIIEIYFNLNDLNVVIKPALFTFGILMETSKAFAFYVNRIKLGKALKILQQGVFLPNANRGGPIEETWIRNCIVTGRRQAVVGGSLGTLAITLLGTLCFVKKVYTSDSAKWELPFGRSSVINATFSPNYELVLIFQTVGLYYSALTYISTDLLISNVLAHLTTQCKILRNFVKCITQKSYLKMIEETGVTWNSAYYMEQAFTIDAWSISWKYLKSTLKEIVDYHTAIIDISKRFEEIFNIVMLVEHVGVLLVMCCVMYDASLLSVTDPRFLPDLTITLAVLVQAFAVGYYGNEVIAASELISKACWEANFIGADIKFQKAWSLVIQRTQKPIVFTVGKFLPLAVTTSLAMLKAAVSYFMVLRGTSKK